MFFFCIILKQSALTDAFEDLMPITWHTQYALDLDRVSNGLAIGVFGTLVVATLFASSAAVEASRKPVIRLQSTRLPPLLELHQGRRWHLFLSHSTALRSNPTPMPMPMPVHEHVPAQPPTVSC